MGSNSLLPLPVICGTKLVIIELGRQVADAIPGIKCISRPMLECSQIPGFNQLRDVMLIRGNQLAQQRRWQ